MPALILASASPRRVQLLREAGFDFQVIAPNVEEAHDASMTCEDLTVENARRKACLVAREHPEAVVLGADTLVFIDNEPLAKPADLNEARTMLRRLSGRTHHVCTGVAIAQGDDLHTLAVITHVTFKLLTEAIIDRYLEAVHVLDKAGAYAVQEHGDMIVERVEGSRTNVIGLPIDEVSAVLRGMV